MTQIPIFTAQGKATDAVIELTAIDADTLRLTISADFAGRDVEEEIDRAAADQIGGPETFRFFDILGLSFETDGQQITGMVGAGSGNIRFLINSEDWRAAVAGL